MCLAAAPAGRGEPSAAEVLLAAEILLLVEVRVAAAAVVHRGLQGGKSVDSGNFSGH